MIDRLIDVSIDHFDQYGLEGSRTRDLARGAQTQFSSITYHFKGKEGLYLAAIDRVTERMGELMPPRPRTVGVMCGPEGDGEQARAGLQALACHLVEVTVAPWNASLVRFVLRERTNSSEAFQRIDRGAMSELTAR